MCGLPRTALQYAMLIMLVPFAAGAAVTEVPFELGKDHRIYVEGTINGSRPLRFLVDTGASAMAVARHIEQDAKLVIDDQSENTGSDGVTFLDYSTHNSVQIGGVQRPMGAVVIDYTGRPFDAVLGWTFFQDKVLEIDYDRSLLRVHDDVPDLAGYARANVRWIDNIPAIQVTLGNGSSTFAPWLTLAYPGHRQQRQHRPVPRLRHRPPPAAGISGTTWNVTVQRQRGPEDPRGRRARARGQHLDPATEGAESLDHPR